jgi:hypothetical protein
VSVGRERARRVAEGCDVLARWLTDAARDGWASRVEEPGAIDDMARRLVDAQAPGLARWVRRLGARRRTAGETAASVGALHLLLEAYARVDALDPGLAADVRSLVGFTVTKKSVLAEGERLEDRWWILGEVVEEEEDLIARRTWLMGEESGRSALILDFAPPMGALPPSLPGGLALDGEVAFYASAHPQRGLLVPRPDERGEAVLPSPRADAWAGPLDRHLMDLQAAWRKRAAARERQPWLRRDLVALRGLRPGRREAGAVLVDEGGRGLELDAGEAAFWGLVAIGGGGPVDVWGELEGRTLRPLAALSGDRLDVLG